MTGPLRNREAVTPDDVVSNTDRVLSTDAVVEFSPMFRSVSGTPQQFVISYILGEQNTDRYRVDKQFQAVVDELVRILTEPPLETSVAAPVIQDADERKRSILSDSPAWFRVAPNPDASDASTFYELPQMSLVRKYWEDVDTIAERVGVGPELVRAVMYIETTRGWYDEIPNWFDANKSILPMNVHVDYWDDTGITREYFEQPHVNILFGTYLLRELLERVENPTVEKVGTLYNNLAAEKVSNYGARVARLIGTQPWYRTTRTSAAAQPVSLAHGADILGDSVGVNGKNNPEDIRGLKNRFIELGFDWLGSNSTLDAATLDTIKLFQSIVRGQRSVSGDGRVDVPGPTYNWVISSKAPRWQRMPAGAMDGTTGFYNFELMEETNEHFDYGTNWMADTIRSAGVYYRETYLRVHPDAALLTINDVSLPRGGPAPPHNGHQTGLDCDIRLPRIDGTAPGQTTHEHAEYDRETTRGLLHALTVQPLVTRILFNDPVLASEGLCTPHAGHDDHIHFEIRPP
ncbi:MULTISPECIES: penicillin-insensitive murein endopeptidase [Halorussus]|uniref:penicillin-insensitive murein endopeptidase n=1 Tax=Halorussus TaxID=1070314 RepID=UPI00209E2B90|nr:penicillin-insensitive murein endopeptidase [Halorussus vallis]USZ77428.1 penicillin-insensitive murein endopeptidase [Halorussus vallis]